MNKVKALDLLTDILLGTALIAVFALSFFFTNNLSPRTKNPEDNVLGAASNDLMLLNSPNITNTILQSDDNDLHIRTVLTTNTEKMINDYRLFELRNTSNVLEKYAVYFDIDKDEFKDVQLFLVNEQDSFPIFQARTDDLLVKDVVIEISPQSLSRYALRTVYLDEQVPRAMDLDIMIKSIN